MSVKGKLTSKSRNRIRFWFSVFAVAIMINLYILYAYILEPFFVDPYLRTWSFMKEWIIKYTWIALRSIILVYLTVCLYVCTGFIFLMVSI